MILAAIVAVLILSALPTFLFCVTFVRLFTAPRELLVLSACAFVFSVPAAVFATLAIFERTTPPLYQGNNGLSGLAMIGIPADLVALILYLIVRTRLRDDWWNDIIAAVVALISIFYIPDMMGLS